MDADREYQANFLSENLFRLDTAKKMKTCEHFPMNQEAGPPV